MKLTHITKETALILKEKGFDALVDMVYRSKDDKLHSTQGMFRNFNSPEYSDWCSAPSQELVLKWLICTQDIEFKILKTFEGNYRGVVTHYPDETTEWLITSNYEDTVEQLIKTALRWL